MKQERETSIRGSDRMQLLLRWASCFPSQAKFILTGDQYEISPVTAVDQHCVELTVLLKLFLYTESIFVLVLAEVQ